MVYYNTYQGFCNKAESKDSLWVIGVFMRDFSSFVVGLDTYPSLFVGYSFGGADHNFCSTHPKQILEQILIFNF